MKWSCRFQASRKRTESTEGGSGTQDKCSSRYWCWLCCHPVLAAAVAQTHALCHHALTFTKPYQQNFLISPYLSLLQVLVDLWKCTTSLFLFSGESFTFHIRKELLKVWKVWSKRCIKSHFPPVITWNMSNSLNILIYISQYKYIVWEEREQSPHHSLPAWIPPSCGITSEQQIHLSPVLTPVPPVAFGELLNTQHVQVSLLYICI